MSNVPCASLKALAPTSERVSGRDGTDSGASGGGGGQSWSGRV